MCCILGVYDTCTHSNALTGYSPVVTGFIYTEIFQCQYESYSECFSDADAFHTDDRMITSYSRANWLPLCRGLQLGYDQLQQGYTVTTESIYTPW